MLMARLRSKAQALKGARFRLGVSLGWVLLVALPEVPVRADSVLIATFSPVSGSYVWTNTAGVIGRLSSSAQVNFQFTPASGQSTATHSATVTLTAMSTLAATQTPAGPDQPINVPSQLTIVDSGPSHATLLSTTFTGDLLALSTVAGPGTADLLTGSHATYVSPTFGAGYFTISPPNVTPNVLLNGAIISGFTGTGGVGDFFSTITATTQPVPEPASAAMFGVGVSTVGLLALGRRRAAARGA